MTIALHADLGRIGYAELMEIQEQVAALRLSDSLPDIFLFAEHAPSLLFSRKLTAFSHETISAAQAAGKSPLDHAKDAGLSVHYTPFAHATYAGPGQLGVYPVTNYTRLFRPNDAEGYNAMINKIMIDTLEHLGVHSELRKSVMVNIDGLSHRIASKASRLGPKLATGGFHIHVAAEGTKHFGMLSIPEPDSWFTSAEEVLGYEPSHAEAKAAVLDSIRKQMKYDSIDECTITRDEHGLTIKKK